MLTFSQFIRESYLDTVQATYALDVFDKAYTHAPVIKDAIRDQILSDLQTFEAIAPIKSVRVIGGILTHQYNQFSDIDINILFDVPENKREIMQKLLNLHNRRNFGQWAVGTSHPINYYVILDPAKFDRANALADNTFDIYSQTFDKQSIIKPINIQDYFNDYKNVISQLDLLKAELVNDLIEYEHLKTIPRSDLRNLNTLMKAQYDKVIEDLKRIVDYGDALIKSRREIYTKDMTPEEARLYGSHNRLPQNIIYKMLEKSYYIDLIHKLEKILEETPPLPYKELFKLLT